jgi:glyoxylase-like metal-dependent hydrolase (beta-lactamase superfamily II)
MELEHIKDNVYYLRGVINIGVVIGEGGQAILIDSGLGDRSGRRILRALEAEGVRPVAVLNTHCHGDHSGGNAYLVERAGVKIYAPLHASVILRQPVWGTLCLFAGADPINELAIPRFSMRPSPVDVIVTEGEMTVDGVTVEVVALPGHTGTHTGYIASGVFFLGDALCSEQELENAGIPYGYSVTMRLDTLQKLRSYNCDYYLLAHGDLRRDIGELVELNRKRVEETLAFILDYLSRQPAEASDVMVAVCEHFDLQLHKVQEFFLLHPTIYSHLSHLHNRDEIAFKIEGNRLLWYV